MAGSSRRFTVLVLLGLAVGAATAGVQQPPARADVVVDTGDGRVLVRRAEFDAPFSGMDLLQAAALDLELAGVDMSVDLRVHAHNQKITGLDLTAKAAIDLYRQIVTEFS